MAFGGAVKLTGESEYRRALQSITQGLREVTAQMKLTSATYSSNDTSMKALSTKSAELSSKLTLQKDKVAQLQKQYDAMSKQYQTNTNKHEALLQKYNDEKSKLEVIRKTLGTTSAEYKAQQQVVEILAKEVKTSTTNQDANARSMSNMAIQIKNAKADVVKTENAIADLNVEMDKSQKEANESGTAFNTLKTTISGQESKLQALKKQYASVVLEQGETSKSAKDLAKQIDGLSSELKENKTKMSDAEKAADKLDKSLDDVDDSAKKAANGGFTVLKGAIANLIANGISRLASAITGQLESAISRVDTINSYKKTMENLGYATEDVTKTTDRLKDGIEGLPTTLPAIMSMQQQYTALSGNIEESTELTLALNNATLAGGQGQEIANGALEQWYQIIAAGKPDLQAWRIINSAMPAQMNQIAESVMGAGKKSQDLFKAWQKGTVTTDEVKRALIGLNKEGGGNLASFEKQAQESTGGVATSMTNVKTAISNALANIIDAIGQSNIADFFNSLKPIIKQVGDTMAELVKKVDWKSFGKTVSNALEMALKGFHWILDNKQLVVNALKLMVAAFVVKNINDWTKGLNNAVKGVADFIGKSASLISTTYANAAAQTANAASTKLATAAQVTHNTVSTAGTLVTKGLTVAAQALNAAWKANPIGLVIGAVTTAISVFSIFTSKTDEATESEKELDQQTKELKNSVEENTKAWNDLTASKQNAINTGMTEMSHYEALYDELQNIVDANGKVKEGYEGRASFITSTLSEALGIEINTVNGVIQKYDELKGSIDEVIEQKKAKIILDAQEELYKHAIEGQTQAAKDLATAQEQLTEKKRLQTEVTDEITEAEKNWQKAVEYGNGAAMDYWSAELARLHQRKEERDKDVEDAQATYDEQEALMSEYAYNIGQYESNMALFHEGKYDEMSNVNWEYVKDYQKAGDAEKKSLEDQIANTETQLNFLLGLKKKSGSDLYDSQISAAEKQLSNLKENLKQYNSSTKTGLDDTKKTWDKSLDNQLTLITGKKFEFKDAGDGNVQMYVNGIATGDAASKSEMESIVKDTLEEIKKKKTDAKTAGENLIDGVKNGISNQDKQNSVFSSISSFASNALSKLKSAFAEKSPSKATEEMGQFLLQGLSIGIEDEENSVLNQIGAFGKNVMGALNDELSTGVNVGSIKTNLPGRYYLNHTNNPRLQAMESTNSYNDMVNAFKTALSEMTVEMDDETMGKFVEKTVARAIYS